MRSASASIAACDRPVSGPSAAARATASGPGSAPAPGEGGSPACTVLPVQVGIQGRREVLPQQRAQLIRSKNMARPVPSNAAESASLGDSCEPWLQVCEALGLEVVSELTHSLEDLRGLYDVASRLSRSS
jgi:hypothetical protein